MEGKGLRPAVSRQFNILQGVDPVLAEPEDCCRYNGDVGYGGNVGGTTLHDLSLFSFITASAGAGAVFVKTIKDVIVTRLKMRGDRKVAITIGTTKVEVHGPASLDAIIEALERLSMAAPTEDGPLILPARHNRRRHQEMLRPKAEEEEAQQAAELAGTMTSAEKLHNQNNIARLRQPRLARLKHNHSPRPWKRGPLGRRRRVPT